VPQLNEPKKIVTIGGGSGTPVINQALLLSGVKRITSIVTVMDSGGITGRMRTDSQGQEIAYSDSLRTLLSLIPPHLQGSQKVKTLKTLLRSRNARSEDLGYTIFSHFYHQENGFGEIKQILESLTGIHFLGEVIPVTLNSTHLAFETSQGIVYKGEHELDDKRMSADSVTKIWLEPQVKASPQALAAIKSADFIIFSCGSLHGSILVNLLPEGIKPALKTGKAKKIYMTNLVSSRNETHNFTPADFIRLFKKYTAIPKPIDILIVPELSRNQFESLYPEVAYRYSLEQSHFLGWEKETLATTKKLGVNVITHTATTIDPILKRIRHDPKELSSTFQKILV